MIILHVINILLCLAAVILVIVDIVKRDLSYKRALALVILYAVLMITDVVLGNYLFGLCWLVLSGLWVSIYIKAKKIRKECKDLYDQYINNKNGWRL